MQRNNFKNFRFGKGEEHRQKESLQVLLVIEEDKDAITKDLVVHFPSYVDYIRRGD